MTKRTAAALMITREKGNDLEVFLAQRAPQLRFFGGYWAMPGGTVAPEDFVQPEGDEPGDDASALQACANRELFEETGMMRHQLEAARVEGDFLRQQRRVLLEHETRDRADRGASPWHEIVAGTSSPPALRRLCRIETPPFAPVRYDTVFFHVPVEGCAAGTAGAQPDVWEGELTQGRFWRAEQALSSWRSGDLLLVPPVIIVLEKLAAATDFEHFAQSIEATAASYRDGALHLVRFSPGIVLAPLKAPTLPPASTTNCCIVGHQELWVVDPGSTDHREQQRLLDLLATLTTDGQRVAGVLLTHHHPDHIGGAAALCKALGVAASGHPRTLERIPPTVPQGASLGDGARIPLGRSPDGASGWELEAIHTPGHDQGHLCFRESRYGTLLAGDMLSTVSTIMISPPEGHLATYLDSLERLKSYPTSTLIPSHGPAVRDGHKLIQKFIRHRRQREETLLRALAERPGAVADLLPRVYGDADGRLYSYAARSLQAGLDKLAEEGRAAEREGEWRLTDR